MRTEIKIRLDEEQKIIIKTEASKAGKTISAYILEGLGMEGKDGLHKKKHIQRETLETELKERQERLSRFGGQMTKEQREKEKAKIKEIKNRLERK